MHAVSPKVWHGQLEPNTLVVAVQKPPAFVLRLISKQLENFSESRPVHHEKTRDRVL